MLIETSIKEKAMDKEEMHIQSTITLNLDMYFDVNDVDIPASDIECVKDTIVNEINEKMDKAVMAIDTFDAWYTIEEVLINGEYV